MTVKLVFAVSPSLSVTVSVMTVAPLYAATGVTVTKQFPLLSGLVSVMPNGLTNAVLLEIPLTASVAAEDRPSPTVNANAVVDVP